MKDYYKIPVHVVEIYPREGTETRNGQEPSQLDFVEIYPREGTETLYCIL